MRSRRLKAPDIFAIKREMSPLLFVNRNRLRLIVGISILLLLITAYLMLYNTYFGVLALTLSADVGEAVLLWGLLGFLVLISLFSVFLAMPLMLGFLKMAQNTLERGACDLRDLFSPFADRKSYRRALYLSFAGYWKIGVTVLAVFLTCALFSHFFFGSLIAGLLCGVIVLLEICLSIWLLLRRFPLLAVALYSELPMRDAKRIARGMRARMPACGFLFFLSFIPAILLGLVTIGVLLIGDTLPRMALSYFCYCKRMNETIIRSEENKQHE